jgi:hypothetical protein
MLIRSETVKLTPQDSSIKIGLSRRNHTSGGDDDINEYIKTQSENAINNEVDGERFKYKLSEDESFKFTFDDGTTQSRNLSYAGFDSDDIGSDAYNNSFYIYQVFDSDDLYNQNLLFTGFIPLFFFNKMSSVYNTTIDEYEFTNLYLTEDFINSIDGSSKTLYIRYFFFNSKTSQTQIFGVQSRFNSSDERRLFLTANVNKLTKTYTFSQRTNLREIKNSDYLNKINSNLPIFKVSDPNDPNRIIFNTDGTYENP